MSPVLVLFALAAPVIGADPAGWTPAILRTTILDRRGIIRFVSPSTERIFGYTPADARNEAYSNTPTYFRKADLLANAVVTPDGTRVVPALAPYYDLRVTDITPLSLEFKGEFQEVDVALVGGKLHFIPLHASGLTAVRRRWGLNGFPLRRGASADDD